MLQKLSNQTLKHFSSLPSITSLNSTIRELLAKQQQTQTLKLYKQWKDPLNLHSNTYILPSILKACAHSPPTLYQLHSITIKSATDADPVVSNSLLSAYSKLGDVDNAHKVFDTMRVRDEVSWNAMVNCFLQNGCFERAMTVFNAMLAGAVGVKPELVGGVVSVCCRKGNVRLGKVIHGVVVTRGCDVDVVLGSALVDLYMMVCDVEMGLQVFEMIKVRNEVAWTVLVSGCVGNKEYGMAVEFFKRMCVDGMEPNRVSLLTILPAFVELGFVGSVKEIHGYAIRRVFDQDMRFSTALLHAYSKFKESVGNARVVFEGMEVKDIVMWSSIIGGCCSLGDGSEGIAIFRRMIEEGMKPNDITLLSVISCCAIHCLLDLGSCVHGYVFKSGLMLYVSVGNSLMNMYSKCGCLPASCQIFKEMSLKDSISWSTLIGCYGLHGCGFEALEVFEEMQKVGIETDSITLLALLSSCNHAGLVEEGQRIFSEAIKYKKLRLSMEHYACYVDLLGKSGKLQDAFEAVKTMPMRPSAKIYSSLVSACKARRKFDVAKILVPFLIKSEPRNTANYTLLSMIYAESGNWFDVEEVRRFMRKNKMGNCHGYSRI